jgi:hypothetical protein
MRFSAIRLDLLGRLHTLVLNIRTQSIQEQVDEEVRRTFD